MKNERLGLFTSSNIADLTTNGKAKDSYGKPFYTLCEEKAMEVILKRPIDNPTKQIQTDWGILLENIAFQSLPLDFEYNVKRYTHLNLPWSGVPDYLGADLVGDIKCPFTLKSAFGIAMLQTAEQIKNHAPQYYWQLVSNALLAQRPKAELTIFVPKITRSSEILETAIATDNLVRFKSIAELPFLPVDSDFPELTRVNFEIPEADLRFLEQRILAAADEKAERVDEYRKIFASKSTISSQPSNFKRAAK